MLATMLLPSTMHSDVSQYSNRAVEKLVVFFEIPYDIHLADDAADIYLNKAYPVGIDLLSTVRKLIDRADELNWELNIYYLPTEIHVKWDTIQEWNRYEGQVSFFFDEERELTHLKVSTSVVQGAPVKERIDFELPPPFEKDPGGNEAKE